MLKKKKNILLVMSLCWFLALAVVCPADEKAGPGNVEIIFYGKVVDHYYEAVAGAEIQADIFCSQVDKNGKAAKSTVKTDKKGLFAIKGKGISLYV